MPDVTANYGMPKFYHVFANIAQNYRIFMSEVLYLHQTFMTIEKLDSLVTLLFIYFVLLQLK